MKDDLELDLRYLLINQIFMKSYTTTKEARSYHINPWFWCLQTKLTASFQISYYSSHWNNSNSPCKDSLETRAKTWKRPDLREALVSESKSSTS